MTDALVSIFHETDESIDIPYINARGPLNNIVMPSWQVRDIEELQIFNITIHREPYDPEGVTVQPKILVKAIAKVFTPELPAVKEAVRIEPVVEVIPAVEVQQEQAEESMVVEQAEAVMQAEETATDEGVMTSDEVQLLRERIIALKSRAEARTLADEFGLAIPETATRLDDMRAALIAVIDAAMQE